MLSENQKYFIQIIKSYFTDERLENSSIVDYREIVSYAKKHEIVSLVYGISKANNVTVLTELLKAQFAGSAFYSLNNITEYDNIKNALHASDIKFVPVKGIVLQQYYKNPVDRSMGDVDLLIDMKDTNQIASVFEKNGFSQKKDAQEELNFVKQGMLYELHGRLVNDAYTVDEELQKTFLNQFWSCTKIEPDGLVLDWNFHLLYLFFHLAKHMQVKGVGFRQFVDIAVLVHFHNNLFDWNWVKQKAKEINLYDFIITVLSFCRKWFGIEIPVDVSDIDDDFYEYASERIFQDGVFGYGNEENANAIIERTANKYPFLISKLITIKKLVFPSYKNLIASNKYSALKGKPFLLPLFWVKRGWHALKSRNVNVKYLKNTVTVSSKSVKKEMST